MIIGAILVIGAMALFVYNEYTDKVAGDSAQNVVKQLNKSHTVTGHLAISKEESSSDFEFNPEVEVTPTPVPEMAVVTIDEYDYIGTISIPELSIELPVMDMWRDDYDALKISPVRYHGSVYTDDMVIAGHNYRTHFNPLHNASVGMEVIFTDVEGYNYLYEIVEFETIEPTAITDMVEFDADLTLFTCTYGGSARFAVRCERK